MSRLNDLLNLSNVPRWGIVPRLKEQSVADHTFRVMVIAWELADRVRVGLTVNDFLYALAHDAEETWTGDISGLAKHAVPELAIGSDQVKYSMDWAVPPSHAAAKFVIKAADIIDCITFAHFYIVEPRRSYVVDRNKAVLLNHTAKALNEMNLDLHPRANEILEEILCDKDRCHTPDWAHSFMSGSNVAPSIKE